MVIHFETTAVELPLVVERPVTVIVNLLSMLLLTIMMMMIVSRHCSPAQVAVIKVRIDASWAVGITRRSFSTWNRHVVGELGLTFEMAIISQSRIDVACAV